MSETEDLPPGLGQPALRALRAAGYIRLEQFTRLKTSQLLALHGLGPKAIRTLQNALAARGLAFADAEPDKTA